MRTHFKAAIHTRTHNNNLRLWLSCTGTECSFFISSQDGKTKRKHQCICSCSLCPFQFVRCALKLLFGIIEQAGKTKRIIILFSKRNRFFFHSFCCCFKNGIFCFKMKIGIVSREAFICTVYTQINITCTMKEQ